MGFRMLRPNPDLDALIVRATETGIFGTKMRSVIGHADAAGVAAVVSQQFGLAQRILAAGMVPIVEPEVDMHSPTKARAEDMLRSAILGRLDRLDPDELVMLKLTCPKATTSTQTSSVIRTFCDSVPSLRRLHPGRSNRPSPPKPRRHRQLLPGTHRRTLDPTGRAGLR